MTRTSAPTCASADVAAVPPTSKAENATTKRELFIVVSFVRSRTSLRGTSTIASAFSCAS